MIFFTASCKNWVKYSHNMAWTTLSVPAHQHHWGGVRRQQTSSCKVQWCFEVLRLQHQTRMSDSLDIPVWALPNPQRTCRLSDTGETCQTLHTYNIIQSNRFQHLHLWGTLAEIFFQFIILLIHMSHMFPFCFIFNPACVCMKMSSTCASFYQTKLKSIPEFFIGHRACTGGRGQRLLFIVNGDCT